MENRLEKWRKEQILQIEKLGELCTDILRESGLSDDVIHTDGKRGRIKVVTDYNNTVYCAYKFYPYKNDGKLSSKNSRCIPVTCYDEEYIKQLLDMIFRKADD